jgi:rhamnose transport system substrate-binding protein
MYEGFREACEVLGARALLSGPAGSEDSSQSQYIEALLGEGVDALAVAANDKDELSAALHAVIEAGIPVVSLDSTVNPADRLVHIQQASPEMIGRVLIQAGAQMIDGEGQFAILSTAQTMPNQASWVRWMQSELAGYPEKYQGMELVEIAYGLDEYRQSAAQTASLLQRYPDLKLIIAPTTVGIRAAAETVAASGSLVKVTGLGLPSDMEAYVMDGVCPWMYLWNPTEVGYLAAYATDALVRGTLTGAEGEILSAGELGDRVVTGGEDGGTEIVLGNPKMFDASNITVWKEVF